MAFQFWEGRSPRPTSLTVRFPMENLMDSDSFTISMIKHTTLALSRTD
jgi:hypothetical protein